MRLAIQHLLKAVTSGIELARVLEVEKKGELAAGDARAILRGFLHGGAGWVGTVPQCKGWYGIDSHGNPAVEPPPW